MGLLPPQARLSGEVLFEGRDLSSARPADLQKLRGLRMAMIFQEPMTALNPVMRVGDQIAEAVVRARCPTITRARRARQRAIEAMREVAIPIPSAAGAATRINSPEASASAS